MRFNVGDPVTPKKVYTGHSGWTNEQMCKHSKGIRFGGVSHVKSINDTSMELEGEVGTYTPERFEHAKNVIIHHILKDL